MDDQDVWVGRLVRRYQDNKVTRAKLKDDLNNAGKTLLSLAEVLDNEVKVGGFTLHDSETIEVHRNHTHITPNLIGEIHGWLETLKEAREEQARLEGCMREAGLGDLIR